MRELDEGHKYALAQIGTHEEQVLTFLKRNGGPVQRDEEYPGTLSQEVIRALIARTKYLDALMPCREAYVVTARRRASRQRRIMGSVPHGGRPEARRTWGR